MKVSTPSVQCPNPACLFSENLLGEQRCSQCKTLLVHRYLWAVGETLETLARGTLMGDRYLVAAPHIWLDTQPALTPDASATLPDEILPYLRLYSYHLHTPTVYGFCKQGAGKNWVLLLDNVPLDENGQLYPAIATSWEQVSAVRQIYWLWQMLELWTPLKQLGVASSLLHPANIRVEGWRVRLRELIQDKLMQNKLMQNNQSHSANAQAASPNLATLATLWQGWLDGVQMQIWQPLQQICERMSTDVESKSTITEVATLLNQLMLEQAARLPLRIKVAGGTTTGPQRAHNEDACYPLTVDSQLQKHDPLVPNLAIICDGIGGHAGGEVASQMAVRSLQLQILAMLSEVAEQPEVTPPEIVIQQLEAVIRVVNNMIAEQNNAQGREARQRMGTTTVLALQLPQHLAIPSGSGNTHELYVAHVGDSRAYWLTSQHCHLLTLDDDVAVREACMGRSLYWEALRRTDAAALTQALGTRDGELLRPTVRRFLIEEDGILLLCSDGLSDGDRIPQNWQEATVQVMEGRASLPEAVQYWLNLADERNGHDNASVVLMHCQVSPEYPKWVEPVELPVHETLESELSDSARALLYDQYDQEAQPVKVNSPAQEERLPQQKRTSTRILLLALGVAVLMFTLGAIGVTLWRQLDPFGFQRTFEKLIPSQNQEQP